MKIVKLTVIPKPVEGTRVVLVFEKGITIKGGGDSNLVCGSCDAIIAENINDNQIRNIVVKCGTCGKYSEIPLLWKYRLARIEEKIRWPVLLFGILILIVTQIDSELPQRYENLTKWIGIILVIISTISSMYAKKIIQYFTE